MSVTRPDITIDLAVNDACDGITLTDVTGLYNATTNPEGYGLTDGPDTTDIDNISIRLNYTSLSTYITFLFTVSSGTITAATLSVAGGSSTSILSLLSTTNWYTLLSSGFDLTQDFGVTVPSVEDGVYEVEYELEGDVSGTSFAFTTSSQVLNICTACACITRKFLDIDPSCDCFENKIALAMKGDGYLKIAEYAVSVGDLTKAVSAVKKAQEICNCECEC